MALDFPNSPVSGDIYENYTYDGVKWIYGGTTSANLSAYATRVYVNNQGFITSDDVPSEVGITTPTDETLLWYNAEDGRLYAKYNDRWVDASPQVTQLVHWDDVQDTPTVPVITAGTTPTNLLWNTDDGRLYVEYQGQWIEASPQLPLEHNINVESVTFDDATVQSTAWLGDTVRADMTPADVWWDPEDGRAYIKYNEQWVDIAPTIPVQVPSDISELTDANNLLNRVVIPGPYADDYVAASAGVLIGSSYYRDSGQVFVRLT